MKIGAQLYTVRKYCEDLKSFGESLKKVADIGYKYVQVSGTCGFDAEWLDKKLRETGLKCAITHTHPDRIKGETSGVIAEHNTFGCDYIGIGGYDLRGKGVAAFLAEFIPPAKEIKKSGKLLMYHNHAAEFDKRNGVTLFESLAAKAPAELLGFTLDTYWVQAAGGDPVWWINHLKNRVDCVHFKDMSYDGKMAAVGEGNMNFPAIIAACEGAGTKYALVEQDECGDQNPFNCLKKSFDCLTALGL